MAGPEAGLELPIGLTEQKFLQQLARIEARAIKSANSQAKAFVKANDTIVRSTAGMSGQVRGQLQNVSFQLQDVFVQLSSGTSAAQALGQQLPQLLGGFGAMGAVLGLVASAAIPLAANFLSSSEAADQLGDAVDDLQAAVSAYREAVENSNASTEDLAEKYGVATEQARALLGQIETLARLEATSKLNEGGTAIIETFSDLVNAVRIANAEIARIGEDAPGIRNLDRQMRDAFGLSIEGARQLNALLTDYQAADSIDQKSRAIGALSGFLTDAANAAGGANAALNEGAAAATKLTQGAYEFADAEKDAAIAAGDLSTLIASIDFSNPIGAAQELSGVIGVMVGQAQTLIDRLGAAAQAARQKVQSAVARDNPLDPLGAFSGGQGAAMNVQVGAGGVIRTPEAPPIPSATGGRSSRRSGGGRGRGGSGREERPFFENLDRDILSLERQVQVIGKTSEEVATMEARWAMLDEAKRRGMTINETLNAQIGAQAAKVGTLTAELERGELAQQQFDEAVEGVADAFAGALLAGESLREGLAQVFKQIASDILQSGIRNAISGQLQGSGGGGFLAGIGKLLGFASGGYTGAGGTHDPAGIVHRGEYVFSKRAVERMGVGALDALHRAGMNGYADGGHVSPTSENGPEIVIARNAA